MSRSLSTDILTAGEGETVELKCYNNVKNGGVTFADGERLDAGYIYPFYYGTTSEGESISYDPYYEGKGSVSAVTDDDYDCDYTPLQLYNKPAVDDKNFVPESAEGNTV